MTLQSKRFHKLRISTITSILILILGASPVAAWQDTASIGGVVTRTDGTALAGGYVELRGSGRTTRTTRTDEAGNFLFANVIPGEYWVRVQQSGYDVAGLRPSAFADEVLQGGKVTLNAGESIRDFHIAMIATGIISGRLTRPNGVPMPGVGVRVLRRVYQDGQPRLIGLPSLISAGATTNDRGEYRLFSLPPGEYYLQVNPRGTEELGMPVYFPGTRQLDQAGRIEVGEGQETTDIDVIMQSATPVSITGTAISDVKHSPYSELRVVPMPRDLGNLQGGESGTWWNGVTEPAGRFKIAGSPLAPGAYDLFAILTGADRDYFGSIPIVVADQTLEDLQVQLYPGADVVGRVITQGEASKIKLRGVPIHLRSGAYSSTSRTFYAQNTALLEAIRGRTGVDPVAAAEAATPKTNDDGTFSLRGIPAGTFVVVPSLPNGLCLIDVLHGDKPVLDSGLVVSTEKMLNIEVAVSTECSIVRGVVRSGNGSPAFHRVTLVPSGNRRRTYGMYRTIISDHRGGFSFESVSPGEYKVFAWASAPDGAWTNAAYLSEFEERGTPVNAASGSTVENLEVDLIRK